MSLNKLQIAQAALNRVGRKASDAWLLSQALIELGLLQRELDRGDFLPEFLVTTGQLALPTGAQAVSLPSNYARIWGQKGDMLIAPDSDPTQKSKVRNEDWDVILSEYETVPTGLPLKYDLIGRSAYFSHVADVDYTATFFYYQSPSNFDDLGNSDENLWSQNADGYLVARLAATMSGYVDGAFTMAQEQLAANLWRKIIADSIMMHEADRDGYRGDV